MLRWFHVEPTGGLPYTPPLDGNNATYAGGFRKLRTDYTGFCCRIRWTDQVTAYDIGFKSNGQIDDAAILSAKGTSTTCVVTQLYNQTGDTSLYQNDLVSTAPIIYKDAAFITDDNGKICVSTDETVRRLLTGSPGTLVYTNNVPDINMFIRCKITEPKTSASQNGVWNFTTGGGLSRNELIANFSTGKMTVLGRRLDANSFQSITSTSNYPDVFFVLSQNTEYTNRILQLYFDNSIEAYTATFQTAGSTSSTNSTSTNIGVRGGSVYCRGLYSEFILWTNDQSANYASIRNNIINYYA